MEEKDQRREMDKPTGLTGKPISTFVLEIFLK